MILRPTRVVLMLGIAAALAGCAEGQKPGEPTFYRSMASAGAQLDASAAASMISGYRANNGLPPVTLDPALMSLAEAQARAMVERDRISHNTGGAAFIERLRRSGYDAKVAAENVSAGYHTLAEAFSGWRDSPPAARAPRPPGRPGRPRSRNEGAGGGRWA